VEWSGVECNGVEWSGVDDDPEMQRRWAADDPDIKMCKTRDFAGPSRGLRKARPTQHV
jgi:hypothetical protein